MKALAAAALVACGGLLALSRVLQTRHPLFAFVGAFAEAAIIGGLADWYAVVALFRRPLGLPIPHTAIIPNNQGAIAEKLGEFVEEHFLKAGPIRLRLQQVDFARMLSEWLQDPNRSRGVARMILRLLPEALSAAEISGLKVLIARVMQAQLRSIDLTPLVAGALRTFVDDGGHQRAFNDVIGLVRATLNKPETRISIREKLRAELPTLLRFYRADAYLLNRVVASAASFLEEVWVDPNHPLRGEIDRLALSLIERAEGDPEFAAKLAILERQLLARPEIGELAEGFWSAVKAFAERSANGENRLIEQRLANLVQEAGVQLDADPGMRTEINRACATTLESFIAAHKGGASVFIADQVKAWDMRQLIEVIELNVGRDLQYIRFNGTVIGGLAGLAIHAVAAILPPL
jgi:uncharacterized membrane-anchored protein YjiN (DUF445 family)